MHQQQSASDALTTLGFLLGKVSYKESDLIVTLYTEALGKVSALARGARKSQKRFGGSLEPVHTLRLSLSQRPKGDLYTLKDASIERVRAHATASLQAIECAGRALLWVKRSAPSQVKEPLVFQALSQFVDCLDHPKKTNQDSELASFGLTLLRVLGFGIDFGSCVRCGKACPKTQGSFVDAARGGLVCRRCGGARTLLSTAQRARLESAASGMSDALQADDSEIALGLISEALEAHLGVK